MGQVASEYEAPASVGDAEYRNRQVPELHRFSKRCLGRVAERLLNCFPRQHDSEAFQKEVFKFLSERFRSVKSRLIVLAGGWLKHA